MKKILFVFFSCLALCCLSDACAAAGALIYPPDQKVIIDGKEMLRTNIGVKGNTLIWCRTNKNNKKTLNDLKIREIHVHNRTTPFPQGYNAEVYFTNDTAVFFTKNRRYVTAAVI